MDGLKYWGSSREGEGHVWKKHAPFSVSMTKEGKDIKIIFHCVSFAMHKFVIVWKRSNVSVPMYVALFHGMDFGRMRHNESRSVVRHARTYGASWGASCMM